MTSSQLKMKQKIRMMRSLNNERLLEQELQRYFKDLMRQILDNLTEYWSEYQLLQGHVDLITQPITDSHSKYYDILSKYNKREYRLGREEANELIVVANERISMKALRVPLIGNLKRKTKDLFSTIPWSEEDLLERSFIASRQTLARVTQNINQIITEGYVSGKGINYVASLLTKRFTELSTWEAKRIARTEIHNSHNQGVMRIYKEVGVEYTQWISAGDDGRTRESHLEVDGEIIPIGAKYSNGLEYPGDTNGPIEEWINCRCSNAPYVIPYGYMAPSHTPFREEDLIQLNKEDLLTELKMKADNL